MLESVSRAFLCASATVVNSRILSLTLSKQPAFGMALRTIPSSTPLPEVLDIVREDGAVIISEFITPELLAEFEESCEPFRNVCF